MTKNVTPTKKWSKPEFKCLGRIGDVAMGSPGIVNNGINTNKS